MNYITRVKSIIVSNWMLILISIVAIAVRVYSFGTIPPGLNADEASIGYDAYAVLNYGIDRNGMHNPVHFIAWGSGQNALYGYLAMPLILLFDLTPFSIRAVNLVLGLVSLYIFYLLVKKVTKKEIALTAFFLLAINPWHIMLSRWALESNIFPAVFMLALYFLVLSFEKKHFLPISFLTFALSLYAYGISYFFIPVFLMIVSLYILYHKKVKLANFGVSALVLFLASLPAILFVMINYFKLGSIETPLFTIPRLTGDAQFMTQSSIFNKDFLKNAAENFKFFLKYFILQEDVIWNVLPKFGYMYLFSLPFALLGLIRLIMFQFKPGRFKKSFLFLVWFLVSVVLTFTVEICTNRINIIFFPVIFLVSIGIFHVKNRLKGYPVSTAAFVVYIAAFAILTYKFPSIHTMLIYSIPVILLGTVRISGKRLQDKNFGNILYLSSWIAAFVLVVHYIYLDRSIINPISLVILLLAGTVIFFIKGNAGKFLIPVAALYIAFFSMFTHEYFVNYPYSASSLFYESFGDAIKYASQNTDGKINVTDKANMPYIFVLFYEKTSPEVFMKTVQYINPGSSFQGVRSFDRYNFEQVSPDDMQYSAFVVHNSDLANFSPEKFEIKNFKLYSAAIKK